MGRIRSLWGCSVLLSLALTALAWGQTLRVEAPEARTVAPGEFVTLVYRVTSTVAQTVEVQLAVSTGWLPLRAPGALQLVPNEVAFVSLTLPVPQSAAAGSEAVVTLTLSGAQEQQVVSHRLTVAEQLALALAAPAELVVGEALPVTLRNTGNVPLALRLALERGIEVIDARTLELRPQEVREVALQPDAEGRYNVVAYHEGVALARQGVQVLRFGVPPPPPLRFGGTLRAELGSAGYSLRLRGAGQLSDFVEAELQLLTPNWLESRLGLSGPRGQLTLGRVRGQRLGLTLPSYFGVAYQHELSPYRLLAGVGWRDGRPLALVGAAWQQGALEAALLAGVLEQQLYGAARWQLSGERARLGLQAEALGRSFGVNLRLEGQLAAAPASAQLALSGLGDRAALRLAAGWQPAGWQLATDMTVPFAEGARDANLEVRYRWRPAPLEELSFGVRFGLRRSEAQLRYLAHLGERWQLAPQLTVGRAAEGEYARLSGQLALLGSTFVAVDGALSYLWQQREARGELGVRGRWRAGALTVGGEARWFGGEQLALSLSGAYALEPLTLELAAGLQRADGGVSASLRLASQLAFGAAVPEPLVATFGGRNLGRLEGRVEVDGRGLAGVEVQLERFRLVTDGEGRFAAELPPGRYTLRLDERSLPASYRLTSPERVVELAAGELVTVDYQLIAQAALAGRVLLAESGEGVPARLSVRDADGRLRSVSAADGRFVLSGLPTGETTVQLVTLPPEFRALGETSRTVVLVGGEVAELTFELERIPVVPRQFAEQLRIRQVIAEVERVPPGAAPRIRVTLSEAAERVRLVSAEGEVTLSAQTAEVWEGRLPLPPDAALGLYPFTVIAERGAERAERRSQLLVDPSAPAYRIDITSPLRPGQALALTVQSYLPLAALEAELFGASWPLAGDDEGGRWQLSLTVPEDAADAVYQVVLRGRTRAGEPFEARASFRVLAP